MTKYRIFRRTWWRDRKCTIPGAGRRRYTGQIAESVEQARAICKANNLESFGSEDGRGPYGAAYEYESC